VRAARDRADAARYQRGLGPSEPRAGYVTSAPSAQVSSGPLIIGGVVRGEGSQRPRTVVCSRVAVMRSEKLSRLSLAVSSARRELDATRARWLAAPPGETRACSEAEAAQERYLTALEAYYALAERIRLSTGPELRG
jgi:hypothetical protein